MLRRPGVVLSLGTAPSVGPAGFPACRTRITPDEARRALYIDFEGRKGAPPVLLGCTRRSRLRTSDTVWQAVTEPRLTPFAVADGIESLALPEAVERILVRAEKRDRLIVAWTEHELDVVREYCPEELERFEARFRNARDSPSVGATSATRA